MKCFVLIWFCLVACAAGQSSGLAERIGEKLESGRMAEAEPLIEELVEAWRAAGDTGELGRALHTLGLVKDALLKPDEAVATLEEASRLVTDRSELGDLYDALGKARQHRFDFTGAEAAFLRALELREGEWVDVTKDHLALLYLETGRVSRAGSILSGTLERTGPGDVPLLVQRHGYLGRFHLTVRNYGRARDHFETALELAGDGDAVALWSGLGVAMMRQGDFAGAREVLESAAGRAAEAEDMAVVLNNLGAVLLALEEPEIAARRFEEGLGVVRGLLGERHAGLAVWHNNLGVALERGGNLEAAKASFESALASSREDVIDGHELRAKAWGNLAVNALRRGDEEAASSAAWNAASATESGLRDVTTGGDEAQRLNYKSRTDVHSVLCSLEEDPGRILDLILATTDVVAGGGGERAGWREVQRTLGERDAWVRYVRYWDYRAAEAAYGAFVVTAGGEPQWVRLTDERRLKRWLSVIEGRIGALAGKGRPPVLTMEAALKGLESGCWAPLRSLLPEQVESVWVTADGAMHFVSFAVLLDERGRFLCELIPQLVIAENGQRIVESRKEARKGDWRVLGVSDYRRRAVSEGIYPAPLVELCADLEPLRGVSEEMALVDRAARRLAATVTAVAGAQRTDLEAADVLHVAAHGFFLGEGGGGGTPGLIDFDRDDQIEMESGIILADDDDDDGLVFSSELAELDLSQSWIAAVSSCRSGLGTAVSGEGVVGLRRALSSTGVENVVLALWPVADEAGARVMGAFYATAVASGNVPGALWAVQREFLKAGRPEDLDRTVMEAGAFVVSHRGGVGKPVDVVELVDGGGRRWGVWVLLAAGGGLAILALLFGRGRADAEERRPA